MGISGAPGEVSSMGAQQRSAFTLTNEHRKIRLYLLMETLKSIFLLLAILLLIAMVLSTMIFMFLFLALVVFYVMAKSYVWFGSTAFFIVWTTLLVSTGMYEFYKWISKKK